MKKTSTNPDSSLSDTSHSPKILHGVKSSTSSTHEHNKHIRDDSNNLPPFASTDLGIPALPISPGSHATHEASSQSEHTNQGPIVGEVEKPNVAVRFWAQTKSILLSSWINILLIFVPIGIASHVAHLNAGVTFAMNAIAIIPLAGLLSYATESVAHRMGDTIGALMNVSFGNAVELIIFIALTKNEIRIVQAALLGSILANLLLILGMCFLVGGLRYREQIYNSTVTQMSACLLSLSVGSLLLPTAFHASFNDASKKTAERSVLKVSRGTSVILLIVYALYLVFQLKSHAYMYQSTPQHVLDEEMAPGPAAAWMESSSDDSSSSSSSDSDSSNGSNTTRKRFKRVMTASRLRRKSSSSSKDTVGHVATQDSTGASSSLTPADVTQDVPKSKRYRLPTLDFGEEADDEKNESRRGSKSGSSTGKKESKKDRKRREKRERKADRKARKQEGNEKVIEKEPTGEPIQLRPDANGVRHIDFAVQPQEIVDSDYPSKRPFNLRSITNLRPQLPSALSQTVFSEQASPNISTGPIPHVRYGIRRINSLPTRLNETSAPATRQQSVAPDAARDTPASTATTEEVADEHISRTTAILLLLISTGLVALCADFLVESINDVVKSGAGISEVFIGLIILPLVGNAAEHVTAVTVAAKNKMDLAIGVAIGSSIQIALFITPFIVLLGWCMGKEMTLYFTLFETVSLFVSTFVVNFMVLDGRSNYLEGSLLCASYVIIAVAAAFYPSESEQSNLGGNAEAVTKMIRSLVIA